MTPTPQSKIATLPNGQPPPVPGGDPCSSLPAEQLVKPPFDDLWTTRDLDTPEAAA